MSSEEGSHASRSGGAVLAEGPVERICRILCRFALIGSMVIINLEILTRNLFDFSFYLSDEYGGYLLVVLTFLSLPLCIAHGSFHRVTFVLDRLPRWLSEAMLLGFDILALLFSLVVLWEVSLLVISSATLETTAPTMRMTPLWMPQLVMPLGMAAASVTLVRAICQRLGRLRSGR